MVEVSIMIITKTPFRISFCGGGSDIQSFYEKQEGCVISATMNKYMYISIHPYFDHEKISLKYSKTELVDHAEKIEHRILREALCEYGVTGVEITSTADIPAGTGLGSSSSFTVGLIHALNAYTGRYETKETVAAHACDIEINRLGGPIGKQDQYAAAFGGLNFIRFMPDGRTLVEPICMKQGILDMLDNRLLLFYTGRLHDANKILTEQKSNMKESEKMEGLKRMCGLARELKESLKQGNLDSFGMMLHENWLIKRTLAKGISVKEIDEVYETAMKHGAKGGKLLGAGGGGFLLFYCEEERQEELKKSLKLREFPFHLEQDGTTIIFRDDQKCCKE